MINRAKLRGEKLDEENVKYVVFNFDEVWNS
jgi:hypothetical protein